MQTTQGLIAIRSIEDEFVVLENGTVVSLLEASGALFSVISPDDRQTLVSQFQAFLNSLEFPIQILVVSRQTNFNRYFSFLREKLKSLEEQGQGLLGEHLGDYLNFINGFLSLNRVLDKRFFVAISYQSPTASAKSDLGIDFMARLLPGAKKQDKSPQPEKPAYSSQDINQLSLREESVANSLRTMGLEVTRLSGNALTSILYQFYNPELGWKDESDIAASGAAGNPKALLAPTILTNNADHVAVNNLLSRGFGFLSYPEYLSVGWLIDIIESDLVFNLSLFFSPIPTEEMMKLLQKQVVRIESQIGERMQKGLVREPSLEEAYKNVEGLRTLLTQGQERMYDVGGYLCLFAENAAQLNSESSKVQSVFSGKLVTIKPLMFQQLEAYQTCLPYNDDKLRLTTKLNTGPASTFFPFLTANISSSYGVLYGVNLLNNSLVIIDRFALENPHMAIFAQSGAGKSFFVKLEIMRSLYLGTGVIVIDVEDEYAPIGQYLGGAFLPLSLSSEYRINPFDLSEPLENESLLDILKEKTSFLIGFFRVILGSITPDELAILDKAVTLTYQSFNITPETAFNAIKAFPTLSDFEMVLASVSGGEPIAQKLYPYTKGSFAGLINRPTNIDIGRDLVIFGIKNLADELKPVMMNLVVDFVYTKMRKDIRQRILIIEEAWRMMRSESGATFLLDLIKRGRKYRLGITTITQDVEDFLLSPHGKPVISNSAMIFLMRQSPAAIDILTQVFKLTPSEKDILLRAEVGEGIFFTGLKHVPMKVVPSYAEDQVIANSPIQQLKINEYKAKQP